MPQNRREVEIGSRFGKLIVLESIYKKGIGYLQVICDCGNTDIKRKWPILSGKVTECIKCTEKIRGERRKKGGFKDISGTLMGKLYRNARIRNLNVKITPEFLYNLFIQQKGICALSGLPISIEKTNSRHQCTASLDRIDSSKDYEEGNIQWVHKDINWIKQNFDQNYFIYLCQQVTQKQQNK